MTQPAVENSATRLGNKLKSGELSLEYREQRGYLDDLLAELGIAPSSQLLVFSPTSLQHKLISPEKPRAVYFNDDTYIGFVQNSNIIEVTTIDEKQGIVFYTFDNTEGTDKYFERASQTCLVCHDTQGTMGGGVPMLMALSSLYSTGNVPSGELFRHWQYQRYLAHRYSLGRLVCQRGAWITKTSG